MLRILWTNQTRDPIVFWVRTVVWSFKWSSPQPFGNSSNIVNVSGPSATVITHLPPKLFGPHEREMLQIERSCSSLSLWIGPTQTSLACSSRILLTHYIPVGHLHIQHHPAAALHPFDYESSGLPAAWFMQQWSGRQQAGAGESFFPSLVFMLQQPRTCDFHSERQSDTLATLTNAFGNNETTTTCTRIPKLKKYI